MLNLTKDNFAIVRNTAKDTSAYQPRCFAFQPAISSALPVAARITLATTPFTGQKLDASDGLMYYGARYYDAALGRFISADTILPNPYNPQALNRYSYVYNNPVRYTDPSGHCPLCAVFYAFWELFFGNGVTGAGGDLYDSRTGQPCGDTGCVTARQSESDVALGVTKDVVVFELGGKLIGKVAEGVKSALGLGATQAAEKAATQVLENPAKALVDSVSKKEARNLLREGIDGLSKEQTKKALEILGKQRVDNVTMELLDKGELQVIVERAGTDGFQRVTYTVDLEGKTIGAIQEAFSSEGELIHVHDWISDEIIQ